MFEANKGSEYSDKPTLTGLKGRILCEMVLFGLLFVLAAVLYNGFRLNSLEVRIRVLELRSNISSNQSQPKL